jgi:hypothetical protein
MNTDGGDHNSSSSTNLLIVRLDERVNNMMAQIKEFTSVVQHSLNDLKIDAMARDKSLRNELNGHVEDIDELKIKVARAEGGIAIIYLIGTLVGIIALILKFT